MREFFAILSLLINTLNYDSLFPAIGHMRVFFKSDDE